jgi:hypothetical protein
VPFSFLNGFHYNNLFSVETGKVYVLRFDAIASADNKILRAFVLQSQSPYHVLTAPVKGVTIGTTKQSYEIFLPAIETVANIARLQWQIMETDGTVWIDNIQFQEANVTAINPDDSIRFEYNPTFLPKTVDLQHNYMDVKGNLYSGNLTLSPFSSIVLMRIPTVIGVKNAPKNTFDLTLFPNPAQQQVTLDYQLIEKSQVQITVFDTLGKVVLQTNKEQQLAGKQQVKLNISGLATGVYYVEMRVNNGVVVEKLVVE